MKKRVLLFSIILLLFSTFLFVSCSHKETTSLLAKKDSFTLALGGSVNIENYYEIEGNGDVYYAIENPEVLQLDGTHLRGIAVGSGVLVIESGGFSVRIHVDVVDANKISVVLSDQTFEYDGKTHLPAPEGSVPEGTTVRFFQNGEPFSGAVEAGDYDLTAEIILPAPYYTERTDFSCRLTIKPKRINMTYVSFSSRTFTYDGSEKKLEINGTLPDGVTVQYENNRATDAGEYTATASFSTPDEKNYYPISPMTATLSVKKCSLSMSSIGFSSRSLSYDGNQYSIKVNPSSLPAGANVHYYLINGEEMDDLNNDYSFKNSGVYQIGAELILSAQCYRNYSFTTNNDEQTFIERNGVYLTKKPAQATLNIRKTNFYNDYAWSLTDNQGNEVSSVPYGKTISVGDDSGDYRLKLIGTSHGIGNEFPAGASVLYDRAREILQLNDYHHINSGTYTVIGSFAMPEGSEINYNPLSDIRFSFFISRTTIDMSNVRFNTDLTETTFDNDVSHDIAIDGSGMEDFDRILTVSYKYKYNDLEWTNNMEIKLPGRYQISASFEVICADKENYATPQPMTYSFNIRPVRIIASVSMPSETVTFDNSPHVIAIEGELPEGLTVLYTYNGTSQTTPYAFTNAGRYEVKAKFNYKNWGVNNYGIWFTVETDYGESSSLTGVLTVNKADITLTEEQRDSYHQAAIPVYSANLVVSDIGIAENEDRKARFKRPNEKIVPLEAGQGEKEGYSLFYVTICYNPDLASGNYEDYEFRMQAWVEQRVLSLAGVRVDDQFIAHTGTKVTPVIRFGTDHEEYEQLLTVTTTSESDLHTFGKHICTVTLAAKEPLCCALTGATVFPDVAVYIYNSNLYEYNPGTSSLVKYKGPDASATLPEGTTGIQKDAFSTAHSLQYLTIPDSVQTIVDGALFGADNIISLSLPTYFDLNRIFKNNLPLTLISVTVRIDTTISDNAFSGNNSLKEVCYLSPVTTVGEYAFEDCTSLEKLTFVEGCVPEYAENSLYGCRALKNLTVRSFPSASYYFGSADKRSYRLETITLLEGTHLADNAFAGLSSVAVINLPSALSSIGQEAFRDVRATVDLSGTALTVLQSNAFSHFAGELTLPATLTEIGSWAFGDCTSSRLVLPKNVAAIGENAFTGCTSTIIFATDSVLQTIGTKVFYGYAGSTIDLPSSVTALEANAFESSKLTSFVLPSSFTIGASCFKGCKELTQVTLNIESIPDSAFYGCSKLTQVTLVGTEEIAGNAFYNCGLVTITLPETLTAIGTAAFYGCPLDTVYFTTIDPPSVVKNSVFPTSRTIRFYVPYVTTAYQNYLSAVGCDMTRCTITGTEPLN